MLKIFGKNTNQLFRNSHKNTFSMPQPLQFSQTVYKCTCGYDYVGIITTQGKLYFLFQSKFYFIENVPLLWDIATSENTVTMLTQDKQILVWDFDEEKIYNNNINYSKIKVKIDTNDTIKKIEMGESDIFLISEAGKLYHFKRNQWYQTKSFSNIQSVQLNHKIIDASSGANNNLFLSYEGLLFTSTKENPLNLVYVDTSHKFMKISTNSYNAGITKRGTIMIWGNSIHGNFKQPTQFAKLTKKFVDIKIDKQNGYAIADDGQVWVWGVNANGQLGISDYQTRIKPFPLITLQKKYVKDIFCGHSYTCCLYESNQKSNINIVRLNRKIFECETIREQFKGNQKPMAKKNQAYINDIQYQIKNQRNKSPNLSKKSKSSKSGLKKSHAKRSSSPSPSPLPSPSNSNSNSNCSAIPKFKIKNQNKYEHHKKQKICISNEKIPQWTIKEKEKKFDQKVYQMQIKSLQLQNIQINQQNQRLKHKISQQQQIISDITVKIRLLQQAIDEHERTLTSRDHILQEYQARQQQYINHIDQLQRKIDEIVHVKQKNNQIMVIYDDLKVNFQKQRTYYTDKIKQHQLKWNTEQNKLRRQIEDLKKKFVIKQAQKKQNNKPDWQFHSPIVKKPEMPYFKYEFLAERQQNPLMESVIDQIETNKSIIKKSANKLIAMLDISQ